MVWRPLTEHMDIFMVRTTVEGIHTDYQTVTQFLQ